MLCLLLLLVVGACGGGETAAQTSPSPHRSSTPTTTSPSPAATCSAVEHPTVQDGGHLIGDNQPPVPYSSTPGSSGWHSSGAPPVGVHDEPLTDPQIVSVLHLGGVVAAYDDDQLDDGDIDALESLGDHDDRLTVAPYDGDLPTPLSLVGWGVLQRCQAFDSAVVEAFVEEAAGPANEH